MLPQAVYPTVMSYHVPLPFLARAAAAAAEMAAAAAKRAMMEVENFIFSEIVG
jgi:hypothetical protein